MVVECTRLSVKTVGERKIRERRITVNKTRRGFDVTPTCKSMSIYREEREREREISGLKPNKGERRRSGL